MNTRPKWYLILRILLGSGGVVGLVFVVVSFFDLPAKTVVSKASDAFVVQGNAPINASGSIVTQGQKGGTNSVVNNFIPEPKIADVKLIKTIPFQGGYKIKLSVRVGNPPENSPSFYPIINGRTVPVLEEFKLVGTETCLVSGVGSFPCNWYVGTIQTQDIPSPEDITGRCIQAKQ